MVLEAKRIGVSVLHVIVVLALLGCPGVGSAQGNWSLISLPRGSGKVVAPRAVAVDAAGNLYVADDGVVNNGRIQKRDAQGTWSLLASSGTDLGRVNNPSALAVDGAGNLDVADGITGGGRIQQRDAQQKWSVIAAHGSALGQVVLPWALAADSAGNLYVAEWRCDQCINESVPDRVQKRDAHGNWSVIAPTDDTDPPQVRYPTALAVDDSDNLYVAEHDNNRIQKRDAQGTWSLLASSGTDLGRVDGPDALAVDASGNLYVADRGNGTGRIQKRDAQGNWSVIATGGTALGQVDFAYGGGLAVDPVGNLYVADYGNNRVQEYTPSGGQ